MYSVNPSIYTSIKEGPPGKEGKPGPPGMPGKGIRGEKGNPGAPGDKGDPGPTGNTGPIGPTGQPGEKGEPNGPTGATGLIGPTGYTGPAGDNLIYYLEPTSYHLKIMNDFNKIDNNDLYISGNTDDIKYGVLHLQYSSFTNKYIKKINASRELYKINFNILTSYPIKLFYMTTLGNPTSVPISYTSIKYVTDSNIIVSFDFDSIDSLSEYMYPGALYNLYIIWF